MTGGHYFWQQVSWIAAVGDDETSRDVAWASGSYTPTPAFIDQSAGESLCIFVRAPHSLHRTQWKAQTPQPFGDFGIGITRGWTVEQSSHVTELHAFGHRLVVRPFTIVGETCVPVDLKRIHRTDRGQGRTHPGEADFDELIFPDSAEIFGFHASIYGPDDQEINPEILVNRLHDTLRVSAGARSVRLLTLPGGETVQTIETDSRSLPLVRCAARTIYAGEIL